MKQNLLAISFQAKMFFFNEIYSMSGILKTQKLILHLYSKYSQLTDGERSIVKGKKIEIPTLITNN